MHKLLKIKGMIAGGRRQHTITKQIDVPDFQAKTEELGGYVLSISAEQQEKDWLTENYDDLVAMHYRNGDLDLIIDAFISFPRKPKQEREKDKIAEIHALLREGSDDEQWIAEFMVVLANMWPEVKGFSVDKIIDIVSKTKEISVDTAINVLKSIRVNMELAESEFLEAGNQLTA